MVRRMVRELMRRMLKRGMRRMVRGLMRRMVRRLMNCVMVERCEGRKVRYLGSHWVWRVERE